MTRAQKGNWGEYRQSHWDTWGRGGGRGEAYDWNDFVLDGFGERYYVEEAGEVELGGRLIRLVQAGVIDVAHRRGQ